ncbi:unnamed protein product [Dracunculus medinensis]|uniref:SSD domain-containing protein n=1 Tax=Dracunculus medinensis TaxID=318479 RepID=A0A158Q3B0_DRAME|nr:unnamed protein product [Dracunculus medinensis]
MKGESMDEILKCENSLEELWMKLLGKYSRFIARNPWPFIVAPCIFTAILSTGIIYKFEIIRGIDYLYSPINAKWKAEERVFYENWASSDRLFYPGKDVLRRKSLYLIIESKDQENVLRPSIANDFINLLDWIVDVKIISTDGTEYTYRDICLRFQNDCFMNAHARLIADIYRKGDQSRFNITYPIFQSKYRTEPIDLSKTLGNIKVNSNGHLISATAWLILYQFQQDNNDTRKLSSEFEINICEKIKNNQIPTSLLNIYYFHSNTFEMELKQSNLRLLPSFILTFIILVTFSILSTFNLKCLTLFGQPVIIIDWILSKPLMGIIGVLTTLMAIISAIGLLLLMNVTFVDMATVMPFLSLTIGIDDTFLILAAWHETSRTMSVYDRIEKCMKHAAASITITSITDAIAFLIGAIAPLPAVIYFCYYSSVAIVFIFLYSMTIFIGFLSIQGQWEDENRNNLFYYETIDFDKIDIYSPTISSLSFQFISLIIFVIYIIFATNGIGRLRVGFDVIFHFLICFSEILLIDVIQKDSPSRRFLEVRSKLFVSDINSVDIAVINAPNMAINHERIKFLNIVNKFSKANCTQHGNNSIDFWYFGYKDYIDQLGFEFDGNLEPFLMSNDKYKYDILYNSSTKTIQSFRFNILLKSDMNDNEIVKCANELRSTALSQKLLLSKYFLADDFIIWPQTLQDLYISIIVMMLISLVLIRKAICSLIISMNIISISVGIIGYMAWLNIRLDASSMITIAMSVGFSVDFAAHITFAYISQHTNQINAPYGRLTKTLGTVGWPVIQASLSVFLGILPLRFVDSVIVQTCFKTVALVICLGTLHALLFLPLFLMNLHLLCIKFFGEKCQIF